MRNCLFLVHVRRRLSPPRAPHSQTLCAQVPHASQNPEILCFCEEAKGWQHHHALRFESARGAFQHLDVFVVRRIERSAEYQCRHTTKLYHFAAGFQDACRNFAFLIAAFSHFARREHKYSSRRKNSWHGSCCGSGGDNRHFVPAHFRVDYGGVRFLDGGLRGIRRGVRHGGSDRRLHIPRRRKERLPRLI